MKFVADESIDHQIVVRLREDGHIVLSVAEMEPGLPDDAVLNLANESQSILLTADKDFGDLVFRLKRIIAGVVLIRLSGLRAETKGQLVSTVVRQRGNQILETFTVITPGRIRIRRHIL